MSEGFPAHNPCNVACPRGLDASARPDCLGPVVIVRDPALVTQFDGSQALRGSPHLYDHLTPVCGARPGLVTEGERVFDITSEALSDQRVRVILGQEAVLAARQRGLGGVELATLAEGLSADYNDHRAKKLAPAGRSLERRGSRLTAVSEVQPLEPRTWLELQAAVNDPLAEEVVDDNARAIEAVQELIGASVIDHVKRYQDYMLDIATLLQMAKAANDVFRSQLTGYLEANPISSEIALSLEQSQYAHSMRWAQIQTGGQHLAGVGSDRGGRHLNGLLGALRACQSGYLLNLTRARNTWLTNTLPTDIELHNANIGSAFDASLSLISCASNYHNGVRVMQHNIEALIERLAPPRLKGSSSIR